MSAASDQARNERVRIGLCTVNLNRLTAMQKFIFKPYLRELEQGAKFAQRQEDNDDRR